MNSVSRILLSSLLGVGLMVSAVGADERQFGYTYLSDSVLPKNKIEVETWATLRSTKDTGKYARWDLRQEIEYGLTDTWTGALYLNSKSEYANGVTGKENSESLKFDGISLEIKHMFMSRHLNSFGVMPYLELTYSGKELELEEKLILDRNLADNWVWALNIIGEQEWEYSADETESKSKLIFNSGLSYQLNPNWSLGVEGSFRTIYTDFYKKATVSAWFVGPTIHFGTENFQITASLLKQTTQVLDKFESIEARIITGIFF